MKDEPVDRAFLDVPHQAKAPDEGFLANFQRAAYEALTWRTKRVDPQPWVGVAKPVFVKHQELQDAGRVIVPTTFELFQPTTNASAYSVALRVTTFWSWMTEGQRKVVTRAMGTILPVLGSDDLLELDRLYVGFLNSDFNKFKVNGRWVVCGWGNVILCKGELDVVEAVARLRYAYGARAEYALRHPGEAGNAYRR